MMDHVLSLSYGKDSLACLGAIEQLGWPLDRIVHAEVWATDTIPADLPPMVEFKAKADRIIKERWGIEVEHVCAMTTYQDLFYKIPESRKLKNTSFDGKCRGFPFQKGAWCQRDLKVSVLDQPARKKNFQDDVFYRVRGKGENAGKFPGWPAVGKPECNSTLKRPVFSKNKAGCVQYIGIAADEPNRFGQLSDTKRSPLVEAGWDEAFCRRWCEENDLLSPIYTAATRGGCWFCHNQGVEQLRQLRKNYPELWALMLKWDADSSVPFHPDGHTVHDFDERFRLEDEGLVSASDRWSWNNLKAVQLKMW